MSWPPAGPLAATGAACLPPPKARSVLTTISDAKLADLAAEACIQIDATGKITEYQLSKASGNARFDATLIEALASIKEFRPPTLDVKDIVTGAGVCLSFKTKQGHRNIE